MGLALYTRSSDGALFAIVSRKEGPSGAYLWQYRIEDDGSGAVTGTKVREFGSFRDDITMIDEGETKIAEIEAIAVDNELGYVYYSDEWGGIKKYHADPDHPDAATELAVFGTDGFTQDREGISIYKIDDGTGYILVSDQQANAFRIFKREGEPGDPHNHQLVKVVQVSTNESDGSDVTSTVLDPRFPSGLFVAMSDNRTFHYYSWDDIAGDDLVKAPNGLHSSTLTVPSSTRFDVLLFDLGGVLMDFAGFDELAQFIAGAPERSEIRDRWIRCEAVRRFERGEIARDEFATSVIDELEIDLSPSDFLRNFVEWAREPIPRGDFPSQETRKALSNRRPEQCQRTPHAAPPPTIQSCHRNLLFFGRNRRRQTRSRDFRTRDPRSRCSAEPDRILRRHPGQRRGSSRRRHRGIRG